MKTIIRNVSVKDNYLTDNDCPITENACALLDDLLVQMDEPLTDDFMDHMVEISDTGTNVRLSEVEVWLTSWEHYKDQVANLLKFMKKHNIDLVVL